MQPNWYPGAARVQYFSIVLYSCEEIVLEAAATSSGALSCSRQRATCDSNTADLNGFCRLQIAPSLVDIARKSGDGVVRDAKAWPEITMIGTPGRY